MKVYFYNAENYNTFTQAYVDGAVYQTGNHIDLIDPDNTLLLADQLDCLYSQLECMGMPVGSIVSGVILPETKKFISLHELYVDLGDHSYEQIVAKQKQGA